MSIPNRTIDASLPLDHARVKREPIEDRRVLTSRVRLPVMADAPTPASDRIGAIDAMALCMSDGCVGG